LDNIDADLQAVHLRRDFLLSGFTFYLLFIGLVVLHKKTVGIPHSTPHWWHF